MTVQKDLRRIGLADQEIDVGIPSPGRYQLDVREAGDLGSGVIDGIVIGTLVGAVLGVVLLVIAVPHVLEMGLGAIVLGILIGGFWGSFFGGLGGMVIKASAHDGAAQWCAIPEGSAVWLVVARAGARADATRTVMRRDGARTFLRQAPSPVTGSATSSLGAPVPAGAGHLPLGGPSLSADTAGVGSTRPEHRGDDHQAVRDTSVGHPGDQSRTIGIPRGAFLLLVIFLVGVSVLWANVYLRVVWRV